MNKVGSLPAWLNDLAGILQKKSEQKNIIAETKVLNLPTVNWEGETFYVRFDENGATLYNKFATIVKEIEHASSIDEVDKFLNANTVTASDDSQSDNSLDQLPEDPKDSVQEASENEGIIDVTQPDAPVVEEVLEEQNEQEDEDDLTKELEQIMLEEDDDDVQEDEESESDDEFASLKNEVKELRELVENLIAKFESPQETEKETENPSNQLEERLAKLENKYAELYRAYTAPKNDQYDLKCQDEEMKHVNEGIELSQKIIDKEHELDLSKQEERGKLNADFLKEILDDVKENLQDIVDDSIEEAKEVVEDVVENGVEPEDAVSDSSEELEQPEEDIILLEDPDAIYEFSNQICPFCHQKHLSAVDIKNDVIGVKCANCEKEFAVNKKDNTIHYKK